MLYCPKCNATYQEGTQRFCSTDGSRLVSGAAAKSSIPSQGVFTSLLGKATSNNQNDRRIIAKPVQTEKAQPVFHTSFSSKVFNENDDLTVKTEKPVQVPVKDAPPVIRMVKPSEIASGTAEIGDRQANPTGRLALTWENTKVLLGQTIKGRYYITEKMHEDEATITYLADDKIIPEKQVVVRVLMEENKDPLVSKIFSEERVSLAHINHPNIVSELDSGELLEGMPFVVSEKVDGFSLKEKLEKFEQFNPLRTARIVRQVAYALSEVHQNGILHRSLKPSSIFLTVSEVGTEQVKVADFIVSNGAKKQTIENAKYLSPEQLEGKMPNYASDLYSLAVIAYQMLTGSMPFEHETAEKLLKSQRDGLSVPPSKLRSELSKDVDWVFEKALAFSPADRYPKARDFGDALFAALSLSPDAENAIQIQGVNLKESTKFELPSAGSIRIPSLKEAQADGNQMTIQARPDERLNSNETTKISAPVGENTWEKRSPEPTQTISPFWMVVGTAALLLFGVLAWQSWKFLQNLKPEVEFAGSQAPQSAPPDTAPAPPINSEADDTMPPERQMTQPANTEYFENTKAEQKSRPDALKNYRGFKLYFPKTWSKNAPRVNPPTPFLDISKKTGNGDMVEQFLVTYYNGTGLFSKDKELFPQLVDKSNRDLKAQLKGDFNYRVISEGEKVIQQNRWNVYEVVFQISGHRPDGSELTFWGRRMWLPTQNKGLRNGLVITLLATSLSTDVTSSEQIGNTGDLASILENFEPSTTD